MKKGVRTKSNRDVLLRVIGLKYFHIYPKTNEILSIWVSKVNLTKDFLDLLTWYHLKVKKLNSCERKPENKEKNWKIVGIVFEKKFVTSGEFFANQNCCLVYPTISLLSTSTPYALCFWLLFRYVIWYKKLISFI